MYNGKNNYNNDSSSVAVGSRTRKNEDLYKEIGKTDLTGFNVSPKNEVVVDADPNEIDVAKLKKILDTNYSYAPRSETPERRVSNYKEEVSSPEIKEVRRNKLSETSSLDLEFNEDGVEITKEYDLNFVIDKAKEENEIDYEDVKGKKLRETELDILKNLDVRKTVRDPEQDEDLLNLINTISINERQLGAIDPDVEYTANLFNELMGGSTGVMPSIKELEEKELDDTQIKKKKFDDTFEDLITHIAPKTDTFSDSEIALKEEKSILDEADDLIEAREIEKTMKIELEIAELEKNIEASKKLDVNEITSKLEMSKNEVEEKTAEEEFYTKEHKFKEKDFEDLDLDGDKKGLLIEAIAIIALIIFVVGLLFFIKSIVNF